MTTKTAQLTNYSVTFERVGRECHGETRIFTAADADDLAEDIHRFARGRLGSKWFDVDVDLETMRGSIEAGRFGRFTIALATDEEATR